VYESSDVQYVIDGGSLLQKIPWQKGSSFGAICTIYSEFLQQRYTNLVVVFGGYLNDQSTKNITHIRREKGTVGTRVKFSKDTPFKSNRVFLKIVKTGKTSSYFFDIISFCKVLKLYMPWAMQIV
jgi:hypothetical protein